MKLYRLLLGAVALCFFALGADAQYNPWWQWARADTLASLGVSGSPTVLAVKNGKSLFGRITANANNVKGTIMGDWTFSEYDTNGVQLNTFRVRGKVAMIDAQGDSAGNWYVLGRFYDTLVLPTNTFTRPNPDINTEPPYFMLKIVGGSFIMGWVARIGNSSVSCQAFTLDRDGILLAVDSQNATAIYDVSPLTGAYNTLFSQRGPSTTTSLQRDSAGRIYIAGGCARKGFLDFNGVVENFNPGGSYAYVASYTPSGTHVWHHVMNDPTCERRKISLYKNLYLYYTGTLADSLTLAGVQLGRSQHTRDFMAAMLDARNGGAYWVQQSDTGSSGDASLGGWAYHAGVTPDTALLLFAQGNSQVNWGNGISTPLGNTYSSVVLSKGSDGAARWARTVEADLVSDDRLATEGEAAWVSGYTFSNTAFVRLDTLNLRIQARRWVPFVARLRFVQPPFVADTGVSVGSTPLQALIAAPNPARNAIRISGLQSNSSIQVSDLSGRVVLLRNANGTEATLDVSALPRGLYLLTVRQAGRLIDARRIALQ